MSKPTKAEAGRLSADTLTQAVQEGVERALAARRAMTELTPAQTQAVSGAAAIAPVQPPKEIIYGKIIRPPIIYGLIAPDPKTLEAAILSTDTKA